MTMTMITGASKGIGKALAYEFAKHGHDVVLVARDESLLQSLVSDLKEKYRINAEYHLADLSIEGSAEKLYSELKGRGFVISCLVNNAGIGIMESYAETNSKTLHDLIHINIVSLSELTQFYLRDFLANNHGSILQLASTAAFQPGPHMAAYYASKAYVVSLSHAIAHEVKGTKVSISILCPGPTKTDFFPTAGMVDSHLEKGSIGMMTPEEVAKIAYKGLKRKKLFIIPGMINKTMSYLSAITPKGIAASMADYIHNKS